MYYSRIENDKGMEKFYWIIHWTRQRNLAVVQSALRETLIFMEKVDLEYASEFNIRYHGLEEGQDASFFLCKELIPGYLNGITGEYATPAGYFVDEKEAEEFDKQ